jgi:uncharacterized membrane protein
VPGNLSEMIKPTSLPTGSARPSRTLLAAVLLGVLGIVVWYLWRFVRPYASLDPAYYDNLWSLRHAFWLHLVGGLTALLIGPLQLWLGFTRRHLKVHRVLGRCYLAMLVVSMTGASYIISTELAKDWVYAGGLLGLMCAWAITTGMGYLAIRYRNIRQHQDWMIRSYTVASAFVFFRHFVDVMHAFGLQSPAGVPTPEEQKLAAWFCWAVPLLIVEPFIQWRYLRATSQRMGSGIGVPQRH